MLSQVHFFSRTLTHLLDLHATYGNMLMLKGRECKIDHHTHNIGYELDLNHIRFILSEYEMHNVLDLIDRSLTYPVSVESTYKLEKIYNLLLSIV